MADFSELKAAIRQDVKDNTEQEIGGDLLQGDLIRMVDDINAAKVDKEEGKGLSSNDFTNEDKAKLDGIPSDICPDVPADAPSPLYGRTPTHEWQPIALVSGLHIELTIPSSANPAEYEIILSYGNGSVRRGIYYVDGGLTLTDIIAGMRVTVNVKPPHNYTAPRSKTYTSQLGITESYTGTSIEIVDGVYILDKFGGYTPWGVWDTSGNAFAVGVGYKSSAKSFAFSATKSASALHPTDGCPFTSPESLFWGGYGADATGIGLVAPTGLATVGTTDCLANNAIMLSFHSDGQTDWRTADTISAGDKGEYFYQAAAAAARYIGCEGDEIGDWMLSDFVTLNVISNNNDIKAAYNKITGRTWNTTRILSCVPANGTQYWWHATNVTDVRNVATSGLALLIRDF